MGTQAGYAGAGEVVSLGSVASFGGITPKGLANRGRVTAFAI